MNAVAEVFVPVDRPSWAAWVRRELAPFPGREMMVVRLVVTVAIVTIISMALEVPEAALSAFMVFFVTKENRVLTALTGILMIVGVTIAVAVSLLLYRVTYDYPELRIPVMALMVFAGMYLSRVFVVGPLGFAIGFLIAVTQSAAESAPTAETLVRALLWVWVAIVYPIALTVVINQILLPAHPWTALARLLTRRLDAADAALQRAIAEGAAGGRWNAALLEMATRGSAPLQVLLHFAEIKDAEIKHHHVGNVAAIVASEQLVRAAAALEMRTRQGLAKEDVTCAEALRAEVAGLRAGLQAREIKSPAHEPKRDKQPFSPTLTVNRWGNPLTPTLSPNGGEGEDKGRTVQGFDGRKLHSGGSHSGETPALAELRELQSAVGAFREGLAGKGADGAAPAAKKTKKPLLAADAFTNPAHVRFAFKVTLAAMSCYLLYTGLDWPGIHTAFITCCFIALENTGATMRKGWLRITGCAVGGLLGFLAIMYLVPQMESIVSLVLLTAAGTALAGWVAAGSERIAYAGLQIGFAFYMCLFQGFAPKTDFETIRDRLVGIVLGIVVSSVVFRYLWPERAADRLRASLARALRGLAQLLLIPRVGAPLEAETKSAGELRGEISKQLDEALRQTELVEFEGGETSVSPGLSPSALGGLVEGAQAVCLIETMLWSAAEMEEWRRLDKAAQEAEAGLRNSGARRLEGVADFVAGGRSGGTDDFEAALAGWNGVVGGATENDRARLVRRLGEEMVKLDDLT